MLLTPVVSGLACCINKAKHQLAFPCGCVSSGIPVQLSGKDCNCLTRIVWAYMSLPVVHYRNQVQAYLDSFIFSCRILHLKDNSENVSPSFCSVCKQSRLARWNLLSWLVRIHRMNWWNWRCKIVFILLIESICISFLPFFLLLSFILLPREAWTSSSVKKSH